MIIHWVGGKSKIIKHIQPFIPQHNRYIEPFIGGGALFFHLKNENSIINDINKEIINLYQVVASNPEQLMQQVDLICSNYSEAQYYSTRSIIPECHIKQAARTLFLNKTCFNGLYRQNKKGLFNVPWGKKIKCPVIYKKEKILEASDLLKNTQMLSQDFETIIDLAKEGDFVYCDPPYEPLSLTSSFNSYHASGFSQQDQIRLKEACKRAQQRGATVVISNSSAEFIKNLYKEEEMYIIQVNRVVNSKASARGGVDEVIVVMRGGCK